MSKNNNENASIPSPVSTWIKQSQFEEILFASEPNFSKIQRFDISRALKAGENYASVMLRVRIEVELTDNTVKSHSYMMKVPHESDNMQAMLESANFFPVENDAYLNILPKFEALYKAKGLQITFSPRAFKFTESIKLEPKLENTVVMYDLGQDGYKNVNRLEGVDFQQTKFVLQKMAQYTAAGAQYFRVFGPYTDRLMQGMLGKESENSMAVFQKVLEPLQRCFLDNLKNYKDCEKYRPKLVKVFAELKNTLPKLDKYDSSEFNGLIHGDCWINNLLFKFKPNGDLDDMRFVDFQMPRYGHPSPDLFQFLITSVHINHKLKDFDYFISYYHDKLIEHLRLLEYDQPFPTLRDLHIKLYKYGIWAVISSLMALPVVLLDPNESATVENLLGDSTEGDHLKNIMFANKRYITQIEQILPWLDNRGLLDLS
ncbi:hypothetical protein KR044_006405 [Drosophila immigrans]|nr:hypothetical protein KR044_006405 [Drosophila immigrans]